MEVRVIMSVLVGAILGLLAGLGFVYWLRNQPDVAGKLPSLWIDAIGVITITAIGAMIGLLRHHDNKTKNKKP